MGFLQREERLNISKIVGMGGGNRGRGVYVYLDFAANLSRKIARG